ncbi:MAG: 3-phosphoshikimate 1-carboxyvinyltransferase [Actinomycetaceae bacterium]|nr:3-phosphoshikimate 1-carboxyvinyltransferase [Actinomycetaceae bacterium]
MDFKHSLERGSAKDHPIGEPLLPGESADEPHPANTHSETIWKAPFTKGLLDATVRIPGSKSLTNRAIALGAIADKPSVIRGALMSRDTHLMIDAIRELGAHVTVEDTTIRIDPPAILTPQTGKIDCGLAGTVMRFIPALAALCEGSVLFDGDAQARMRPMKPLLDALEELGVTISYHGDRGYLPFTLTSPGRKGLRSKKITIDARSSSQYVSALLLLSPLLDAPLEVKLAGQMPSPGHVHMTVVELERRGVTIEEKSLPALIPGQMPSVYGWVIHPGHIQGGEFDIEPDLTNAGPFLAATLICGGQVRIENWPAHTTQIGDMWRKIIPAMGGRIGRDSSDTLVARGTGTVGGIDWNLLDGGELAPMIAALAAVAVNPSKLTGIGHLTGHETNRLKALVNEIEAIGSHAKATRHSLTVTPGITHAADIATYNDHRMVMFAALLGLAIEGIGIKNPECVSKTFPDFVAEWEKMVATAKPSGSTVVSSMPPSGY